MKARKVITAMSWFVFFIFSVWGNASAENNGEWCSGVKVLGAGASSTNKIVYVRHQRTDCGDWPANTQRWFVLDDTQSNANAMLAAVLTAQATGRNIVIIGKNKSFQEWNALTQVTTLD